MMGRPVYQSSLGHEEDEASTDRSRSKISGSKEMSGAQKRLSGDVKRYGKPMRASTMALQEQQQEGWLTRILKAIPRPPVDFVVVQLIMTAVIWVAPMFGSCCGDSCGPASWDIIGSQLVISGLAWLGMLGFGFNLMYKSRTGDVETIKQLLQSMRLKIKRKYLFVVAAVSLAQCVVFVLRTVTHTFKSVDLFVEMIASTIYNFTFLFHFYEAHYTSWKEAAKCMCTRTLLHCLLLPSTLSVPLVTSADGVGTWFSLSFLGALHLNQAFTEFLETSRLDRRSVQVQLTNSCVFTSTYVFVASMAMMSLETLGDPVILQTLSTSKWNVVSSLYFTVSTMTTVGFGDVVPTTTLGRILSIFSIFSGSLALAFTMRSVLLFQAAGNLGSGVYIPAARAKHIVIAGNPPGRAIIEFMQEVFHVDHDEKASDLRVVVLVPCSSNALPEVKAFLSRKQNSRMMARVTLIMGSLHDPKVLKRACMAFSDKVFLIPDPWASNVTLEDTENVVRCLSLHRSMKTLKVVLLLLQAERMKLLEEAGMRSGPHLTLVALDMFKMELTSKSCVVPGFVPMICNLCKTMGAEEEDDDGKREVWKQEYSRGCGNELYEVQLSNVYAERKATFCEVVLDVLNQTDGVVYLVGLVELRSDGRKRVLVNPGPKYPIKPGSSGVRTNGIFIATDYGAITQCEMGNVFLGRRERPIEDEDKEGHQDLQEERLQEARRFALNEDLLKAGLSKEEQKVARDLVELARIHLEAQMPSRPPVKTLAKGNHVVVLCLGARPGFRLGLNHFVQPLRARTQFSSTAIVVMAEQVPEDWGSVVTYQKVYFILGCPLSVFDLERASITTASVIFVTSAVGRKQPAEPWMADSDAICCTRLVESQVGDKKVPPAVITELACSSNHKFIPLPSLEQVHVWHESPTRPSLGSEVSGKNGKQARLSRALSLFKGAMAMLPEEENDSVGARKSTKSSSQTSGSGLDHYEEDYQRNGVEGNYYDKPRYACGQLFADDIIYSLVANTYYNPSLADLVFAMISAKVVMVKAKREWVGKTYGEYFDSLLWSKELLAVGIYREGRIHLGNGDKKNLRYVYTAPPGQGTLISASDRILCFGTSTEVTPNDLYIWGGRPKMLVDSEELLAATTSDGGPDSPKLGSMEAPTAPAMTVATSQAHVAKTATRDRSVASGKGAG